MSCMIVVMYLCVTLLCVCVCDHVSVYLYDCICTVSYLMWLCVRVCAYVCACPLGRRLSQLSSHHADICLQEEVAGPEARFESLN